MVDIAKVVLVHGAWADSTCWAKVAEYIAEAGITSEAVRLPLSSLEADVAAVNDAAERGPEPFLLVGHSYGGVVITQAGSQAKVAGLVYIAAFAPDLGESAKTLTDRYPPSPMNSELQLDVQGMLRLTRRGVFDGFAQDLTEDERAALFANQTPTAAKVLGSPVTIAAWKEKPSAYLVATADNAIPPALQHALASKLKARTTSVAASHLVMLSQPRAVADFIILAAQQRDDNLVNA